MQVHVESVPRPVARVDNVATGHQPYLWHPGILAKYIATSHAARRHGGEAVHVVVDHDVLDALRLDLPVKRGDTLHVATLHLGRQRADVPVGCQPAIDPEAAVRALREATRLNSGTVGADLGSLIQAWSAAPASGNLAEQLAAVLEALFEPYTGPMRRVMATSLLDDAIGRSVVREMSRDAVRCALLYNEAVGQHPEAGVAPLHVGADAVELPLWSIAPDAPRLRVYADASAGTLFTGRHRALAPTDRLAPRALLLSALMRSRFGLFIHGHGGRVYDRATEIWWSRWTGRALGPMATFSADLRLEFDAPLADPRELRRATWWAHHLPHNIDRVAPPGVKLDEGLVHRKRGLLTGMDADRDPRRRAQAFTEIHRINEQLAASAGNLVSGAQQQLTRARLGVSNRAVTERRDWCFALYPPQRLRELADAVRSQAVV